jgi:hypothetical protein
LAFAAAPEDGGLAITAYDWTLHRIGADVAAPVALGAALASERATPVTVASLSPGEYVGRSRASNAVGAGPWSAPSEPVRVHAPLALAVAAAEAAAWLALRAAGETARGPVLTPPEGTAPFSWALEDAPTGLSIDPASGELAAAGLDAGDAAMQLVCADATGAVGRALLSASVADDAAAAVLGDAGPHYELPLRADSWSVADGQLPPGLTLDGATGQVHGVAASTFTARTLEFAAGVERRRARLSPATGSPDPLPRAFPGAVGHGRHATGGRGGTRYLVTSAADGGPGSLRDMLATAGDAVASLRATYPGAVGGDLGLPLTGWAIAAGQTAVAREPNQKNLRIRRVNDGPLLLARDVAGLPAGVIQRIEADVGWGGSNGVPSATVRIRDGATVLAEASVNRTNSAYFTLRLDATVPASGVLTVEVSATATAAASELEVRLRDVRIFGPRVFALAPGVGPMALASHLEADYPRTTIDARLADGFFAHGGRLAVYGSDMVVRGWRGYAGTGAVGPVSFPGRDGITVGNPGRPITDIYVDRCDFAFAPDENAAVYTRPSSASGIANPNAASRITFDRVLSAEALFNAGDPDAAPSQALAAHSLAFLVGGGNSEITLHRCLMASCDERNPRLAGAIRSFEMVNCWSVNYGAVGALLSADLYPADYAALPAEDRNLSAWVGRAPGDAAYDLIAENAVQAAIVGCVFQRGPITLGSGDPLGADRGRPPIATDTDLPNRTFVSGTAWLDGDGALISDDPATVVRMSSGVKNAAGVVDGPPTNVTAPLTPARVHNDTPGRPLAASNAAAVPWTQVRAALAAEAGARRADGTLHPLMQPIVAGVAADAPRVFDDLTRAAPTAAPPSTWDPAWTWPRSEGGPGFRTAVTHNGVLVGPLEVRPQAAAVETPMS